MSVVMINKAQIVRLQVLYGQIAAREIGLSKDRAARIRWVSEQLGRTVESFSDLEKNEARRLIDGLQAQLGVRTAPKPRRRVGRDQARRIGIDGRHDGQEFAAAPQLASRQDLETIREYYTRLGWDRTRFDAWLRSGSSPLKRKANPEIRTMAEANQVRWALMGMLKRQGKWEKWS